MATPLGGGSERNKTNETATPGTVQPGQESDNSESTNATSTTHISLRSCLLLQRRESQRCGCTGPMASMLSSCAILSYSFALKLSFA